MRLLKDLHGDHGGNLELLAFLKKLKEVKGEPKGQIDTGKMKP